MTLALEYRAARRDEDVARLRRVLALRAMGAHGLSQREIAEAIGITQPAVSQQLKHAPEFDGVHPEMLLEAAGPVLKALAGEFGFSRLGVFGSVGRGDARQDSDIDLVVEAPAGTSSFGFVQFKQAVEQVLGRGVDMVEYGGLTPGLDDDVRREAVLL
ncbi:nucleotidyltransferase domain-containing protein [Aeromicrobium sp. CF3.5]|uniref:nucleotidyltransferase domain-containing protein n=1 Tax=Aeromicrobium sp. CF3.5 TaxID=3373078 RepID=UPI003EE78B8D